MMHKLKETVLDRSTIDQFAKTLHGPLLQREDAEYDQARRVWNGMIDRQPALIARCAGAADVRRAVNFAREHALPLTVKAGGHNVAGKAVCDGGLVIDLSQMNSVRIDPHTRTAHVGPGATWGDFDHEAQAFELATTGGVDSRTGVAGLTLGGGIGYLARKVGLAIDNLIAADVITANGELLHASENENPDLFWALRGGGGSVGVVTSFQFQLHKVGPEVLVAQIFHPFEEARNVLQFYRDFMIEAPDELAVYAMLLHVPPVPPFPDTAHGKIAVALIACYTGDIEEGKAVLDPLQTFGNPILSAVQPMPYAVLQQSFDAGTPDGGRYYYKSCYLGELSDNAIDTIVTCTEPLPGVFTVVGLEPMGGAINRIDTTATAFPHRDAAYGFSIWAGWNDPAADGQMIAWTRSFYEAMVPHSTGGVYLNYLAQDDDDRVRSAYGANYERLRTIKERYDPDNLFQVNRKVTSSA